MRHVQWFNSQGVMLPAPDSQVGGFAKLAGKGRRTKIESTRNAPALPMRASLIVGY